MTFNDHILSSTSNENLLKKDDIFEFTVSVRSVVCDYAESYDVTLFTQNDYIGFGTMSVELGVVVDSHSGCALFY